MGARFEPREASDGYGALVFGESGVVARHPQWLLPVRASGDRNLKPVRRALFLSPSGPLDLGVNKALEELIHSAKFP